MKNLFNSLLGLIVLSVALAPQADAQLVTYQFTGTLDSSTGTAGIGSTIAGSVTLDVGAAPDDVNELGLGEDGFWFNGGFSINGVTDTGVAAGTSFGGNTTFVNTDFPIYPLEQNSIYNEMDDLTHSKTIALYSISYSTTGDGVTSVPNPWKPLADDVQFMTIASYDKSTGVNEWGIFILDTFAGAPTTIIIDGRDTGIDDFEYQGKLVSEYLEDFAAAANNHGGYVSSVAKLTNDLKKAGLLTNEQKSVMMSSANQSSIGK